jgi:hypothetical protein
MRDLDDGPDQKPLARSDLESAILELLGCREYGLLLTHSPLGEYTRHLGHEEVGIATAGLWQKAKVSASELWFFAYGDLPYRGLLDLGVDAHAVHFESAQEKQWYYRWFEPNVVVGIGYWGHTPHLVLHPQRYGVQPIPWLVADSYVANHIEVLVAMEVWLRETVVGEDEGYDSGHRVVFESPRAADFRTSIHDIAGQLLDLMTDAGLRERLGTAGRRRVL